MLATGASPCREVPPFGPEALKSQAEIVCHPGLRQQISQSDRWAKEITL
ncbi:MAG: hypothetical protein M1600_01205 [Firmicutes bacterium]|nr:hypothetical protein [Bacillota bacterium]